ncbi:MAG: hypothetical protein WAL25_06180 [Acidimicrobiia bacterium]
MDAGRFRRVSSQVVISLALTGCVATAGGPSPTEPHGPITTTVPTTTSAGGGLEGYRSCLLDRGVPIGEIGLDGRGRPRMALAMIGLDLSDRLVLDALDECAAVLGGDALDLGADPGLRAVVQATLGDFAVCVRDQGVPSFPDPVQSFDGVGAPFPRGQIPWSDVDLAAAVTVCRRSLTPSSP